MSPRSFALWRVGAGRRSGLGFVKFVTLLQGLRLGGHEQAVLLFHVYSYSAGRNRKNEGATLGEFPSLDNASTYDIRQEREMTIDLRHTTLVKCCRVLIARDERLQAKMRGFYGHIR